jgi:uncharacterized protein
MLDLKNVKQLNKNTWFFRFKKFDADTYLITNDIAKHSFLSKDEFGKFISWALTQWDKYDELVKSRFIKDETYEAEMAKSFAIKNRFLWEGPTLHIIVTSLRCNHKCQYCHAAVAPMSAKNFDMTQETARKVVDTIFYTSSQNITIEFQWGESLVNWSIVKYITKYAQQKSADLQKNVSFALVTNLSLMDDEKLDFIMENSIWLSTSLDGDEEVHNFNRTYKEGNSYKEVVHWIKKINDTYIERNITDGAGVPLSIGALLTVTKKTLPKYKEVIDEYVNLGLNGIFLRPLNPYWFAAAELEKLGYETEDFIDFYKKSMDYIIELNKKGTVFREALSGIYLSKILTSEDPNYLDERSPCGACIGQVAYNYDGKVYSCDEWRMLGRMWDENFLMSDMKETGAETYTNMIQSETTKVMVQASTLDGLPGYNSSVYKPYIGVCPIHSYKTTWNIVPNYSKDHKKHISYAVLDYVFEKLRDPEVNEIFSKWVWAEHNKVTSQCETL